MAQKGASVGRHLPGDGEVWDEDFAPAAFPEFDFPRRRITGGSARSAEGNGRSANGNGRATNGRASSAKGRASSATGRAASANGRASSAKGRTARANGWLVDETDRAQRGDRAAASNGHPVPAAAPGRGVPGRRTVTIRGYGAERNLPSTTGQSRRRPAQPRHQRPGFRADRAAMWAVLLGIVLVVVAAASSHAAVLRAVASGSSAQAHARPATAVVRHVVAGHHRAR